MTLQELINIKQLDNAKYKVIFGDLVSDIYKNKPQYVDFLKNEPDWGTLEPQEISLIVSNFSHLARKTNMKLYAWLFDEKYILRDPYFALNAKGKLRVILLQESPLDYRRNNIFVSKNVLSKV